MRLLPALLFLVTLAVALPAAATAKGDTGVGFVRVWPEWRSAESFLRIKEYLGAPEDTGRETVLRSRPDARAGYYFLVRTRNPGAAAAGTKFVLEIITPDSPLTKTFAFPADLPAREHVFHLGLTGGDWAGKSVQPVAWRLRLLSADEQELAAARSFLWQMPAPAES
jgi:hypothetical protein